MSYSVTRQQSLLLSSEVFRRENAELVGKGNELSFNEKTNITQSAVNIGKLRTIFSPKSIKKKLYILLYALSRSSG